MRYVCAAPGGSWFRIESEAEAEHESALMGHAVARHFREARDRARASWQPPAGAFVE